MKALTCMVIVVLMILLSWCHTHNTLRICNHSLLKFTIFTIKYIVQIRGWSQSKEEKYKMSVGSWSFVELEDDWFLKIMPSTIDLGVSNKGSVSWIPPNYALRETTLVFQRKNHIPGVIWRISPPTCKVTSTPHNAAAEWITRHGLSFSTSKALAIILQDAGWLLNHPFYFGNPCPVLLWQVNHPTHVIHTPNTEDYDPCSKTAAAWG